jgi:chorismate synthase
MTLRYLTAGESHGPALSAIAEGFPAGLTVDFELVDRDLRRRQKGYGRGGRMKIETDAAQFLSGIRGGTTLGSPIAFVIWNKDHENWKALVSPYARGGKKLTEVRPGHADLAGALKYGLDDARDVLERASARSTAAQSSSSATFASGSRRGWSRWGSGPSPPTGRRAARRWRSSRGASSTSRIRP